MIVYRIETPWPPCETCGGQPWLNYKLGKEPHACVDCEGDGMEIPWAIRVREDLRGDEYERKMGALAGVTLEPRPSEPWTIARIWGATYHTAVTMFWLWALAHVTCSL